MLVGPDGKHHFYRLEGGGLIQTHHGTLAHDDLIGQSWGAAIRTHLDSEYLLLQPTLRDLLLNIKRQSQIIFPKDIGYILLRLSVGPGTQVLEAGTGSGALTTALAWFVGGEGRVHGIDRRADMIKLTRENLSRVGLVDRVHLHEFDICEDALDLRDLDAVFFDLPEPQAALGRAHLVLKPGGVFGCILPTANQVSLLLEALPRHGFAELETCEILLRFFKVVPERLRPTDRMVAHTGYLTFARRLATRDRDGDSDAIATVLQ